MSLLARAGRRLARTRRARSGAAFGGRVLRARRLAPGRRLQRLGGLGLLGLLLASPSGCSPHRADSPCVVLVTLDTTRADHLGCYGHPASETPEIDGLAARGCRYETAWTTAPLTLPAHASLFTGLVPMRHGVRANGTFRLPPSARTLAEVLASAGYDTAAFVASSVLDRQFGLDQGFAFYDDQTRGAAGSFFFAERGADEVSRRAADWIRDRARPPFLLWVHFFDPHAPYLPPSGSLPPPDRRNEDPAERERNYLAEIHRTDGGIGRLRRAVQDRGLSDDTVWVVAGDHGESLGEHGEDTHALLLHEATVRIPLVFAGPGVPRGRVSTVPAQITDITPTVIDLVRGAPLAGIDGRSLRPFRSRATENGSQEPPLPGIDAEDESSPEGRVRVVETCFGTYSFGWSPLFAIRSGAWKLVRGSRDELFDLDADPGETRDRQESPEAAWILPRLEEALDRWIEVHRTASLGPAGYEADSRTLRLLEGLGYVAGSPDPSALGNATPEEIWRRRDLPDPRDRVAFGRELGEASTWLAIGRCDRALAAFEPLVREDPRNPSLVRRYAFALEACGQEETALAAYRSLVTLDTPFPARDWNSIGRLLGEMGRLDEAEEALERSIELDPGAPDAYVNLGNLRMQRGDIPGAIEASREAVRISPSLVMARTNLGAALIRGGRIAEGAQHLREARDLDPSSADAWFNYGEALRLQGNLEEARACFLEALDLDPDHEPARAGVQSLRDD